MYKEILVLVWHWDPHGRQLDPRRTIQIHRTGKWGEPATGEMVGF